MSLAFVAVRRLLYHSNSEYHLHWHTSQRPSSLFASSYADFLCQGIVSDSIITCFLSLMDFQSAFTQKCSCGRVFLQAGAFKNHQNNCKKSKKRLSLALAKAKGVLASKKRQGAAALAPAEPLIDHENQGSNSETHHDVQVRRIPTMKLPR